MAHYIKGFVRTSKAGTKEFVILDFAMYANRGTLKDIDLAPGALFRGEKTERLLRLFADGDVAVCMCDMVNKNFSIKSYFRYDAKEWDGMAAELALVRLMTVEGQAPKNPTQVATHFDGVLGLVKMGWAVCSTKGEFFTFPKEMDTDKAVAAAIDIVTNSNAHAVCVRPDGTIFYDPKRDLVPAAPKAAPVAKKVAKAAPVDKNYFYVLPEVNTVLSSIVRKFQGGFNGAVNVLVKGESGTGKTSLAAKFAEKMNWGFHLLNCAVITEVSEIAGQRAIVNGQTTWEWSAVAKAIMAGNCVVVLDEINRAYPNALNGLFGLLDDNRMMWVGAEKLVVGPNVLFYATANIGSQFTGTFQADAALLNRFSYVFNMGSIPEAEEAKVLAANGAAVQDAKDIVRIATLIRGKLADVSCPIRTTKAVSSMVLDGLTQRQAWEFALTNHVDGSAKKEVMDVLNQILGIFVVADELLF